MPELLAALHRNESRSSKFFVSPFFQMRKVLPLAFFSLVVSPRITPSLTAHRFVSPSQPLRSLPLKMEVIPFDSAGAEIFSAAEADTEANARSATMDSVRIMASLSGVLKN